MTFTRIKFEPSRLFVIHVKRSLYNGTEILLLLLVELLLLLLLLVGYYHYLRNSVIHCLCSIRIDSDWLRGNLDVSACFLRAQDSKTQSIYRAARLKVHENKFVPFEHKIRYKPTFPLTSPCLRIFLMTQFFFTLL